MIHHKESAREIAEERWAMPDGPRSRASTAPISVVAAVPASIAIAGPSESFVNLTRNNKLRPPVRFEPTLKKPGDIVL
jgi:hypothetical protein